MTNATRFYLQEIYDKSVGYRPNWEPNKPLRIGDVGILEDNVFTVVGSLEKMGIPMEVRTDESEAEIIDLSSENGFEIKTKAKGQVDPATPALGEMDAGFHVDFKREKSILFRIKGYKTHLIENLMSISQEIKKRYQNEEWEPEWVIINELLEANSATIMMSSEGSVSVGLKAKADVGLENLDIADADVELGADSGGKLALSIVGKKGITPLYRAVGIKRSFFGLGKVSVGSKGVGEEEAGEENPFEEAKMDFSPQ